MAVKPSEYISAPTARLRFVEREGRHILQQLHEWISSDLKTGGGEWLDVPIEREED